MVNLALKAAIASGFVLALIFHGDGVEQRAAASEDVAPAAPRTNPQALPPKPGIPLLSDVPETSQDLAASSFAAEVRRLSAAADEVDRLWQDYKDKCGVQVSRQYDFGREWFSLWDRAAEATVDAAGCDDALAGVRQAGEKVRRETLRARATAHLDRGTEIGMLRWHALQWPPVEEARASLTKRQAPREP